MQYKYISSFNDSWLISCVYINEKGPGNCLHYVAWSRGFFHVVLHNGIIYIVWNHSNQCSTHILSTTTFIPEIWKVFIRVFIKKFAKYLLSNKCCGHICHIELNSCFIFFLHFLESKREVLIEIREMLSTGVLNVTYALAVVNRIIRQEVFQWILEVNCLVNIIISKDRLMQRWLHDC